MYFLKIPSHQDFNIFTIKLIIGYNLRTILAGSDVRKGLSVFFDKIYRNFNVFLNFQLYNHFYF